MPNHWLQSAKEYVRPYYLKWLFFRLRAQNCPTYFRDCWNYPATSLDSGRTRPDAAGLADPPSNKPDILFLPLADWHTRIQRTQHLALTFASMGYRCFYVNPHLGREFPSVYPFGSKRIVSTIGPRIRELHVHLPREPVFHHRCLSRMESRTLTDAIVRLPFNHAPGPPLVITSFPLWADVAHALKHQWGSQVIYDCHDLMTGFGNIAPDLLHAESGLLDSADLVIFSAQALFDHCRKLHPGIESRSILLRNAVSSTDFAPGHQPAPKTGHAPTIGYVGSLSTWFDIEFIRFAAAARPAWRFVLIGRIENHRIESLRHLPNVHLHGEVPYADLPRHLASFDVGIIPFVRNALTLSTNPIKLYEYFAYGLPVVSATLPEVERYSDLVYLADDPAQFLRQLDAALAENDPTLGSRRREIAGQESWRVRCLDLERRLGQS
ncbi:glycosyltransferase [Paludibaculum fermentans]|uniref:Glycosyltransferase n=1 Tax=Paludibaculum fermentans TaxID=1473598 RepID=A0A7S7SIX8_PALFE|nr:glycosyltransferase [Paludibaculum fermentans]QOY85405.1 glycosyltransferase [Paludibaculum fermentans]